MALMKYIKASQTELAMLQECQIAMSSCNSEAHRMRDLHSNIHPQVKGQICETKNAIFECISSLEILIRLCGPVFSMSKYQLGQERQIGNFCFKKMPRFV
jgi:hypothetical protein